MKVTIVEHPLAQTKLSILRAKTTAPQEFRHNLKELSILLFMEAARDWPMRAIEIETPLKKCAGHILNAPIVLVPILRAGLGMVDGIAEIFTEADIGHVGVYRDAKTLQPSTYFCRLPANIGAAQTILLDPMLATGNSACAAAALLKKEGARKIQFVCLLACPPGIAQLHSAHPDIPIVTAAIDPELNQSGYIVPGLGDAGDRYFGTE